MPVSYLSLYTKRQPTCHNSSILLSFLSAGRLNIHRNPLFLPIRECEATRLWKQVVSSEIAEVNAFFVSYKNSSFLDNKPIVNDVWFVNYYCKKKLSYTCDVWFVNIICNSFLTSSTGDKPFCSDSTTSFARVSLQSISCDKQKPTAIFKIPRKYH